MAKRPLKELFNLNKVEEVSVCTSKNPPANGFTQFEIMKNSFSKSEFEDLFEELSLPEYGDFVGYLNLFLEDDVNQVAYKSFIDALFFSLNEVCFDKESTKEEKALKMKDNFDKFIEEYKSSVITKSEDGKVFLNIEKKSTKLVGGFEHPASHFLYTPEPNKSSTWKLQYKDENGNIDPNLVSAAIASFSEGGFRGNQVQLPVEEVAPIKAKLRKIWKELYPDKEVKEMPESISKSIENINKQENSMNPLMEALKKLLAQFSNETEDEVEIEEACGDKIKKAEKEEEIIPAEEVSEDAKIEDVVEPEQEPELAETSVEKAEDITEEPKLEEEIPAVEVPEVVEELAQEEPIVIEEPKIEGDLEEPIQKSEEPSIEEILKAKEDELQVLKSKIEKAEQIQKESEIKLEKAELLKSVESEYSGLAGKSEEILERVYEINKSELSLEAKEFALEALKKLSAKNLELTKEVGVEVKNEIVNSEEEIQKSKIQKAISEHNLTEGQALLYVRGERTLKQAKEISLKKK